MTTGNAVATSNSVFIRPVLESAIAKLLDSIDCQNIYTEDLPPLTSEEEMAQRLQIHRGFSQPELEAWFANRNGFSVNSSPIANSHQYSQVHGMIVSGIAFHSTFQRSYQYIQDKTDELVWALEKNKNLLGDSTIKYINNISTTFAFEQFGETYLYRSNTTFDVHRLITETDGRSYS